MNLRCIFGGQPDAIAAPHNPVRPIANTSEEYFCGTGRNSTLLDLVIRAKSEHQLQRYLGLSNHDPAFSLIKDVFEARTGDPDKLDRLTRELAQRMGGDYLYTYPNRRWLDHCLIEGQDDFFYAFAEGAQIFFITPNQKLMGVFGTSRKGPFESRPEIGTEVKRLLEYFLENGFDVINGGGGGVMEFAHEIAMAFGKGLAVRAGLFWHEHTANEAQIVIPHLVAPRRLIMTSSGSVAIFGEGGFGTFDEWYEALECYIRGERSRSVNFFVEGNNRQFWTLLHKFIEEWVLPYEPKGVQQYAREFMTRWKLVDGQISTPDGRHIDLDSPYSEPIWSDVETRTWAVHDLQAVINFMKSNGFLNREIIAVYGDLSRHGDVAAQALKDLDGDNAILLSNTPKIHDLAEQLKFNTSIAIQTVHGDPPCNQPVHINPNFSGKARYDFLMRSLHSAGVFVATAAASTAMHLPSDLTGLRAFSERMVLQQMGVYQPIPAHLVESPHDPGYWPAYTQVLKQALLARKYVDSQDLEQYRIHAYRGSY